MEVEEEEVEVEDTFGWLIKLCQPTSSQEDKLRTCPFSRQSDAFPDLTSSCKSITSPAGIFMVSPPDSNTSSSSSVHHKFHTPLEHEHEHEHEHSHASDSDDLRPPPPPPPQNDNRDGLCTKTERAVDLVKEKETLGFQMDGCDENLEGRRCGCVIRDHDMEVLECDFDHNKRVMNSWVSKENLLMEIGMSGAETQCVDTEVIYLDSEEYGRDVVGCNKHRIVTNLDTVQKECKKEADRVRKGKILLENWQEGGQKGDEHPQGQNLSENGEERVGISVGKNSREKWVTGGVVRRNETLSEDAKGGGRSGKGEKLRKNGEGGSGVNEGENMRENGQESNMISGGNRLCKNGEEGGRLRKDNLSKCGNGDGVARQVENLQGNGARGLHKAIKVIEEFKYVSSGDGMDRRGKERGALGKRELPLSMTGQGKGVWGEVACGNVVMKGGFLEDILVASKFLIREVDDGSGDDFLETAKKRGMVFPRPRWWPPE